MEEGLPKVPKLDLAQYKYVLTREATTPNPNNAATQSVKEKLLAGIVLDSKLLF